MPIFNHTVLRGVCSEDVLQLSRVPAFFAGNSITTICVLRAHGIIKCLFRGDNTQHALGAVFEMRASRGQVVPCQEMEF